MNFLKRILFLVLPIIIFTQCNDKPIKGSKISNEIRQHIIDLGILNKTEEIILFYPKYDQKNYGNFFTKKRIASYWQNNKNTSSNYINTAFYSDIKSINIKYGDGFEFTSALVIELKSNKKFNVYFNCTKEELGKLHKVVINLWKNNKNIKP